MSAVPKRVFIVPYRNRLQHKFFFSNQMNFILEGETDYEIYFVHQSDSRTFNRGAMKNIGFLAMKQKYPNDYLDMSFIFNDVDTLPFHKIFNYQTTRGTVKHFYGFKTALGGIVSLTGYDFEKINGFPNFWGWGMEDACLQKRCAIHNIKIDRSHFLPIGSPEILQLFDGVSRLVSSRDPERMKNDNGYDGLASIHQLKFTIDLKSHNPADNKYTINNDNMKVINVTSFMTAISCESDTYHEYDLREPTSQVSSPDNSKQLFKNPAVITTDEWTNIPFYPTIQEKKDLAKRLIESRINDKYLQQTQQTQQLAQKQAQQQTPNTYSTHHLNQQSRNIRPLINSLSQPNLKAYKSVNIGLGGVK